MRVQRALALASLLVLGGLPAAWAQFPPPPNPAANPFPPPPVPGQAAPAAPQASPFPPPPGQAPPPGKNPCEAFIPIRAAAEKDAAAIQAAGARKAPREEVCPLFKRFAISEAKMVKFIKANQTLCNIPPQAVKQVTENHAKTIQIRNQVCSPAPRPAAPRLSDAFGGPGAAGTFSNPRPRGTFDTLTGNPLAR